MSYNFKYTKYNQSNELQTKSPINLRSIIYVIFLCFFFGAMIYLALQSQTSYRIECNKKENNCNIYITTIINKREQIIENFKITDIQPYIYEKRSNVEYTNVPVKYSCYYTFKNRQKSIHFNTFRTKESCVLLFKSLEKKLKEMPYDEYSNLYVR